ncbi:hypothetical protein BYT27DRAFT_7319795, partial [Phlegmacium glaucopus]
RPATRNTVLVNDLVLVTPLINHRITQTRSLPPLSPVPTTPSRSLTEPAPSDSSDDLPDLTCNLRNLSSDSSSDSFPIAFVTPASKMTSVNAVVIRHPAHKNAPVFGEGAITAAALLDWENACDDFFLARDPVPEDKKVAKVTGGLHNTAINTYIRNNRVHLNTLTFPAFMTELHEVFLPTDWDQDVLQKILNSRMSLGESFFDWSTSIVSANNLLVNTPIKLSDERIREQLFHNMSDDLREKLKETPTELATLNLLTLQKWLNTVAEADVRMTKATKRSAKRVAMELERDEKKRRALSAPSRSYNSQRFPLPSNERSSRPPSINRGTLPPLSQDERNIIFEHRGCYKCRKLYTDHLARDCPDDFPTAHVIITRDAARIAKDEWERSRRTTRGGPSSRPQSSRPPRLPILNTPVAAISIDSSDRNLTDHFDEDEELPQPVAMTWPSAVVLGNSDSEDSDTLEVSQPLTSPHMRWDTNALGSDGFPFPVVAMLDTAAHIVLISPELVNTLSLKMKTLRKPISFDLAIVERNDKNEPKKIVTISHIVSFELSTRNNSWTSKTIRAFVAPGLCTSILLGLPFLVHNKIVIDCEAHSAFVKGTSMNLLSPCDLPNRKPNRISASPK